MCVCVCALCVHVCVQKLGGKERGVQGGEEYFDVVDVVVCNGPRHLRNHCRLGRRGRTRDGRGGCEVAEEETMRKRKV